MYMQNLFNIEVEFLRIINRKRKDSLVYQRTEGFDRVMSATSWKFGDVMDYSSLEMKSFIVNMNTLSAMKDIDISEALAHVPQSQFNEAFGRREDYDRREIISTLLVPYNKVD